MQSKEKIFSKNKEIELVSEKEQKEIEKLHKNVLNEKYNKEDYHKL